MEIKVQFNIGDQVRDKYTGYYGVITSVMFDLNYVGYCIESVNSHGEIIQQWIDERRLVLK